MAKTATTKFAVLGILLSGPKSGYEIAKFCREVLSSFWSESYGQIYPSLKDLVDEGLAKKKGLKESQRKKAIYSITDRGKKAIAAWAAEPAKAQPNRNELLLKLFFGSELPVEISLQQIRQSMIVEQYKLEQLKSLEQELLQSEDVKGRHLVHSIMTIRLGIRVMNARIEWAQESLASLEKGPDGTS